MGERRGGGVVVNFWDFVELVEFGPPSMKQLKLKPCFCFFIVHLSAAMPVRSHSISSSFLST